MAEVNEYLVIVNPKTGESHAVTEEGFVLAEHADNGFKVDKYQTGVEYTGPLPKLSAHQREALGLRPPTPYEKTVEGALEVEQEKRIRAEERVQERAAAQAAATAQAQAPVHTSTSQVQG